MRFWKSKATTGPTVCMIVATYDQGHCLASLLSSLSAQTYQNLRILVVHDGPWTDAFNPERRNEVLSRDRRIEFISTSAREKCFGHNCRDYALRHLRMDPPQIVGFTNGDNYHNPVFVEALAHELQQGADLAYCNCIHSHKMWKPMRTDLKRGSIDLGCWLAKMHLLKGMTWSNRSFAGDWYFLEKMLDKKPTVAKVDHYLFTHN